MSGTVGTSFWRVAGLSYLQYINKSAAVLRSAVKEPLRSKLLPRNAVQFKASKWEDGIQGKKVEIEDLSQAANFSKST